MSDDTTRTLDENGNMVERPIPPEWTDTTRPATGSDHRRMIEIRAAEIANLRHKDEPIKWRCDEIIEHAEALAEAVREEKREKLHWMSVASKALAEKEMLAAQVERLEKSCSLWEAATNVERAKAERWKRYALAFRAYDDAGVTGDDRHAAIVELEAAEDDLIEHGDLPEGGDQ